jgi:hypothetical protein
MIQIICLSPLTGTIEITVPDTAHPELREPRCPNGHDSAKRDMKVCEPKDNGNCRDVKFKIVAAEPTAAPTPEATK